MAKHIMRPPKPNYTQVPNVLLDYWAPLLTEGELRVALYVVRRTMGFNKDADTISFTQLCEGIVTRDGKRLDAGTGMARSSVNRAIKGLEEKGLLQVDRSGGKSKDTTTYSMIFLEDDSDTGEYSGGGSFPQPPSSEELPPSSGKRLPQYRNDTRGGSVERSGVVAESYPQKKAQNKVQNKVEQNAAPAPIDEKGDDEVLAPTPEAVADDPLLATFVQLGGEVSDHAVRRLGQYTRVDRRALERAVLPMLALEARHGRRIKDVGQFGAELDKRLYEAKRGRRA